MRNNGKFLVKFTEFGLTTPAMANNFKHSPIMVLCSTAIHDPAARRGLPWLQINNMTTIDNFTAGTQIDVVIPAAAKDVFKLPICIEQLIANSLTPIRNIYVVTKPELFNLNSASAHRVTWIDEATYPFSVKDVTERMKARNNLHNNGSWYYQQLLKLYMFKAIPGLLPNALILDSDFFIGQPMHFATSDGKAILAEGYSFKWLLNTRQYPSPPVHSHIDMARRLVPGYDPVSPYSGMHHHLLFNVEIMSKLFSEIEGLHQEEMWRAFIDCLDIDRWNGACEYIIYYHFAMRFHGERVSARHLKACDFIHDGKEGAAAVLDMARSTLKAGSFQGVGCHGFLDLRTRLQTMDYIPADVREKMLAADNMAFKLMLDDGMLQIEAL